MVAANGNGNGNGNGHHEEEPPEAMGGPCRYPSIDPKLLNPHGMLQEPAILPGFNGVPFRGDVPMLRDGDPETRQPQMAMQLHVRVFNLADPKDMEYYEKIWQLIANGFALKSSEEKVYDPESKNWRVFMRWAMQFSYVETKEAKAEGAPANGKVR